MTTKSSKPKAPQTCKKAQPPAGGVVAVTRRLQALSLMPLHGLAEGRNQSIPSLLHEVTGLSKARISKGNLDAIRPSTQAKVDRHLEELLQEQFKGDPEGLQSFLGTNLDQRKKRLCLSASEIVAVPLGIQGTDQVPIQLL